MSSDSETAPEERQTGCVKWFNNKAGYGFLTTSEGETRVTTFSCTTVLSRYPKSSTNILYKVSTLVLLKSLPRTRNMHFKQGNVTGVGGHKLMCETRNAMRDHDSGEASEGDGGQWNGSHNWT